MDNEINTNEGIVWAFTNIGSEEALSMKEKEKTDQFVGIGNSGTQRCSGQPEVE